jgi:hypothetical protein
MMRGFTRPRIRAISCAATSIVLALGSVFIATSAFALLPPEPPADAFKEADLHFRYMGKMINPKLIELFGGWDSDSWVPIVLSVDIAAAYHTNQFYEDEVFYDKSGAGMIEKAPDEDRVQDQIHYRWIGRLDNGLHAVEYTSTVNGGAIFFFRFSEGKGWRSSTSKSEPEDVATLRKSTDPVGKQYPRLVMTIERSYLMTGDPAYAYSIKGNDLLVKTWHKVGGTVVKTIHAGSGQ